jgi:PAS domain S-box-containing protein
VAFATWRLWLPIVVLLSGGAVSGALWYSARQSAASHAQALLTSEARHYSDLSSSKIASLEYSLIRMSRRWAALDGMPADIWAADAGSLIGDSPAVRKLQRLDGAYILRWEVTRDARRTDLNQDAAPAAPERARLAVARTAREATVSDLHEGSAGDRSVVIYVPLYVGARFDGFLAAELDLRRFFSDLYDGTQLKNAVSVRQSDIPIAALGSPAGTAAAGRLSATVTAAVNGLAFDIVVEPGPELLSATGVDTARYILIAGLFVTALAAALAWQRSQILARNDQLRTAHDRLSEHERRYREILRRGDFGFAVADPFGKILEANEPFSAMLGFAMPQHAVGHSLNQFVPPENGAKAKDFLEKLKATTDALHEEITLRQITGGSVSAAASCIVDKAPDGSSRILLLAEDITERAAAHQQMAEARRIYEDIFNTADVAITDVDLSDVLTRLQELRAEGVADLRAYLEEKVGRLEEFCRLTKLNTINRAGLRLFGAHSVEAVMAQQATYFLQGARVQVVKDIIVAMWEGEESLRKELPHSTFTGRDIVVIYSLRLPGTLAEARRVPIVTVDITDVRSIENARRANIAKTQFLASMSHEIRTPLNGVIGNLELLAQGELTPEQEELLFDAEKAAKSLLALIGNILDFSKIEAGKLSIEMLELNPATIVQEAVDIVQSRARQKGIYVTMSIDPDVPQIVKADPSRIRQILLNLLGNSVKFTDVGGVHVALRVRDWDARICQLLFQVHDSGRGFNQSAAASLFQPFTQDQRPAREETEGTGLGLSICKSLVDSFGGEIECESVPERGASFWFTLPVQVVKPAPPVPKPDLLERTVLFANVAADAVPTPLSAYFAARGAKILSAENDAAALSLARAAIARGSQIDLVVYSAMGTSWPAPGVAAALRDHQAMPVIHGPDSTPALWRQALRSGASYLIPKTISEELLDRNLDQVFHGMSRLNERTRAPATSEVDAGALAGKHVLVLEDRLINQTIIQRQLKKLGISCTLASDGMIGLDKVATGTYDLILCDCSMPEMNGYEFTRILRQREEEKGNRHVPVVAMTANAFREDMEKCYAAGMDDFVSKPVTLQRLAAVLSQWLGPKEEPIIVLDAPKVRAGSEALDLKVLQELLGSEDRHIIVDVVQEFVLSAKESWIEVQGQVARRDAHGVTNAAHGAKGEARNAGAVALGDLYEELERIAKNDNFEAVEVVLAAIPAELNRVQDFVDRFVAGIAK